MSATVTIPKTQYTYLLKVAKEHEQIRKTVLSSFFFQPPVKSRKAVLSAFRKSGKYSKEFLKDLQTGLKNSTYFSK